MSETSAIVVILVTAFAWGSWGQLIKRIPDWTVEMFMITLYGSSLAITWGAWALFGGETKTASLAAVFAEQPGYIVITLMGGFLYTLGMWLSLVAIRDAGLVITNVIMPSVAIVAGTVLSAAGGGLEPSTSVPLLIAGCASLICAAYVASTGIRAGRRGTDAAANRGRPGTATNKGLGAAFGAGVFLAAYPTCMSLTMIGPNRPDGLSVFEYMAILSVGSAIAVIVTCIIPEMRKGKGLRAWSKGRSLYHGYAVVSGLAHYGGNIVNALAVPVVGASLAWPMGQTMSLWGYVWGLVYNEFAGLPRRAVIQLYCGLGLFVVGAGLFALAVYW